MSLGLLEEARRRLDVGDPASARRLAERALADARRLRRSDEVAAAAKLLGECLYVIGEVADAWPLAEEALRLDEERGDAAAIGADLNLLGVLEITAGRVPEAVATLRRSYVLREEALGSDDGDTVESLNNLAVALWRSGMQDEAIGLHAEALRRCEQALGEGHRRTAETLNALAVKLESRPGEKARARELYERALASAELALGPDAELVARLLSNVAVARMNAEELEGVGSMLTRAVELHDRHFGPMSRWTAYVLMVQGEHAFGEGQLADARRAFERAFVIRVQELGPGDEETVDAASSLLGALSRIAEGAEAAHAKAGIEPEAAAEAMAEATALYFPVMALRPEYGTPFFANTPADPAAAHEQLRQIARRIAERIAPDARQLAARQRADALAAEADGAFLMGDFATAVDRLREAVALLEVAFGPMHATLVEPLQRLRLVLRMAGTEADVLSILERITEILAQAYGEAHPLAIRALGEQYWQERREFGQAGGRQTADRVRELMGRALGESSPLTQLVGRVLDAARSVVPADAKPDAERLSVRRERFLASPNPLADELLGDLVSVRWATLQHAYGPAIDTPQHLRVLLAEDERLRQDALELLGESVLHQGSLYPATAPALRCVRRLAGDPRVPGRPALLELLAVANAAARVVGNEDVAAATGDVRGLLSHLAANDADPAVRQAALSLLNEVWPPGGVS